jgi:hypothetical protein
MFSFAGRPRSKPRLGTLRGKRALGALLLMMTAGAVAPAAQADAAYEIRPHHSNMCLDVPFSSPDNGVALIQWTCNGQPNQAFTFVSLNNGYYKILPNHVSGKCLDVAGANPSDGTKVQQYTCLGVLNQQFALRYVASYNGIPYYNLVARHSNKCVTIARASLDEGTRVEQWTCVGGAHQLFGLVWR